MSDGASPPVECAGRTTVLLGAGASADAGLLLTSGLASAIVERANRSESRREPAKPDWVRALNAVYAGMVGHRGAQGEDPLTAVNIETLISAVRLLRARDSHEVAPFVAAWTPALSNLGPRSLPTRSGQKIVEAVAKAITSRSGFSDRDVTEAVAEIARAAVRPDSQKPFSDAEAFILASLVDLLGAHDDVSYFEPLLRLARVQSGGVDVITLNYDLTVETAAKNGNVPVNRGIESWRAGELLEFPAVDGVLNLMKLHGSLDWRAAVPGPGMDGFLSPGSIQVVAPSDETGRDRRRDRPWIVVGDREKLATDGPTLPLNFAARMALARSEHLAVVGYSFSDAHINAMIRDWLAGEAGRTMTVLDMRWPRERHYRLIQDFRSAVVARYARLHDAQGGRLTPRVLLLEGRTSERLEDALLQRPVPAPELLAAVTAVEVDGATRFDVTWFGVELSDATITVWPDQADRPAYGAVTSLALYTDAASAMAASPGAGWGANPRFRTWQTGETVSVFAAPGSKAPPELEISGASITGAVHWRGRAPSELVA